MGIADRWKDWDDPQPQGGMRVMMPRLGGAVRTLMMANVVVFVMVWLGTRILARDVEGTRAWVNMTFGLYPGEWTLPFIPVWQFVSYAFLHGGLTHLFWNMLQLYFFGTLLEGLLGNRRFYMVYVGGFLIGAILHCLAYALGWVGGAPAVGASGAVLAVVVAAATLRPNQTAILFMIPVSLKVIAIGLVIFDVYGVIEGPSGTAHWIHLGGAVFGFFGTRLGWLQWDPLARFQARRAIRNEEKRHGDEEVVDRLLEKISREGLGSLSEKEKAALKRASGRTKT